MTSRRELLRYYTAVGLFFTVLLPTIAAIPGLERITALSDKAHVVFFGGYVFDFLFGYYLSSSDLPKPVVYLIYLLGIAGAVLPVVYSGQAALLTGERGNTIPCYALCQCARLSGIFLFFRNVVGRIPFSEKAGTALAQLAGLCFGAYLIHDFFLWAINKVLPVSSFAPVLSVPLLTICIAALSFDAAWLVRRIPRIGKYIT